MKNKKLFAILTLVCFMMTLMPVAAFAADTVAVDAIHVTFDDEKEVVYTGNSGTVDKDVKVANVVAILDAAVTVTTDAAIKTTIWNAEKGETYEAVYAEGQKNIEYVQVTEDGKKYHTVVITPNEAAAEAAFEGVIEFYAEGITGIDAKTVMFTLAVQADKEAADTAMKDLVNAEDKIKVDGEDKKVEGKALGIAKDEEGKKVATTEIAVDLGVKGFASVSKSVGGTVTAKYENGKIILTAVPTDLPQVIEATIEYGMNPMLRSSEKVTVTLYVPAKDGGYDYDGTKDAHRDYSKVWTVEEEETVKVGKTFEITAALKDKVGAVTEPMFVWFTDNGDSDEIGSGAFTIAGASAATVVEALDAKGVPATVDGLWYLPVAGTYEVTAHKTGTYTLHAVTVADFLAADVDTNDNLEELFDDLRDMKTISGHNKVVVKGTASSTAYTFGVDPAYATTEATPITVEANGVAKSKVTVTLYDGGDEVIGETVKIETNSSNVEVSKTSAVTNGLGQISFNVSAVREGSYEIYVSCGNVEETIYVKAGATTPTHIAVAKAPTAPIALADVKGAYAELDDTVRFLITDINGNTLTSTQAAGQKAFDPTDKYYVSVVSQPADSDLTNEDVYLVNDDTKNPTGIYSTLHIDGGIVVEGTYEFKVSLDNGKSVNVAFEVKEFQTPVGIVLEYAAPSVELGGTLGVKDLKFVDVNGVLKNVRAGSDVTLAASGYAVDEFITSGYSAYGGGAITVKTDEKYLGSTITVTAVSERYDLITTATIKVVAEAAGLMFTSKTAEVNVNNTIQVVLVDAQGNRTALSNGANVESIEYVVLEKPEGAKVAVSTAAADQYLANAGSFKMNLTSNKVGNVKVQAIARVTRVADGEEVVKYYTGVQEFAVGTGEIGKSVVMSIGSNELIVGSKVETMDAKPMIQNNRTFVPFRALAEAFGATVAYDQATSSVTAELNGVKVVMTVGAPVYTVNGVEKTADVAPFISDSRTFVPVRFAAEAFGIEVVPTYNEDGSVADVLFNM